MKRCAWSGGKSDCWCGKPNILIKTQKHCRTFNILLTWKFNKGIHLLGSLLQEVLKKCCDPKEREKPFNKIVLRLKNKIPVNFFVVILIENRVQDSSRRKFSWGSIHFRNWKDKKKQITTFLLTDYWFWYICHNNVKSRKYTDE